MSNMVQLDRPKAESPFAQSQRMMKEMPSLMKGLNKQMSELTHLTKQQIKITQKQAEKQAELSQQDAKWSELLYDRMNSLIIESQVTNLLLSELVALQQAIITEDLTEHRDRVRDESYAKILNAE